MFTNESMSQHKQRCLICNYTVHVLPKKCLIKNRSIVFYLGQVSNIGITVGDFQDLGRLPTDMNEESISDSGADNCSVSFFNKMGGMPSFFLLNRTKAVTF